MSEGIYFKFSDGEECEFTREEIAAEDSIEDLLDWHKELSDEIFEIKLMADSFKAGGVEDRGLCYKMGNWRILQHWISRRLNELGHVTQSGTDREVAQAKEIGKLLEKVKVLTSRLAALDG